MRPKGNNEEAFRNYIKDVKSQDFPEWNRKIYLKVK